MSAAPTRCGEADCERHRRNAQAVAAQFRATCARRAHPASAPRPAISNPTFCSSALLLWEVRQDASFEHDQHAVGQPEDLAKLRRHQKNRAASVALGDELLVDMLGRADVQPSRRLLRDQRRRFVREFARNHDLLQIAAR